MLQDLGTAVSVHRLTEAFGVSESTLRRDLDALSDAGELLRTYGGAAPAMRVEFSWHEKESANTQAKNQIARFAAAKLVHPGDVVFIDAGTTPAAVARQLAERDNITIVVAGLAALLELTDARGTVIVLGGRLRLPSLSFLGSMADLMLDMITPDVAFLGADHVSARYGANYPDLGQVAFKTRVMERAAQSWMVVDATKLGGPPPFSNWARLGRRAGVVTDDANGDHAAAEQVRTLRESGLVVHVCGPQAG